MFITWDRKIRKELLKVGFGKKVKENDKIKIKYSMKLKDTSRILETNDSFKFFVGEAPINGIDIAVASMRLGEIARFTIDSLYAYGVDGKEPNISPYATLVYDIEILSIMKVFSSAKKALEFASMICDEAAMFYKTHDVETALKLYNEALEAVEDYFGKSIGEMKVRIMRNLALLYSKLFRWEKCLENADAVLENNPTDLKALMRKIEAHLGLKEKERAKEVIEYAMSISRGRPEFNVFQQILQNQI